MNTFAFDAAAMDGSAGNIWNGSGDVVISIAAAGQGVLARTASAAVQIGIAAAGSAKLAITALGEALIGVAAAGAGYAGRAVAADGEAGISIEGFYDIPASIPVPDGYHAAPLSRRIVQSADARTVAVAADDTVIAQADVRMVRVPKDAAVSVGADERRLRVGTGERRA